MVDPHRILVVDDNEMVALLLSEVLGEEGFDVTTVTSGEDALAEFRKEPFALVLLDLVLPGIGGNEVLKELKSGYPQTDAVMITGHGSMETAVEALRLGAADYITKPFEDLESVTKVVQKIFARRQEIFIQEFQTREALSKTEKLEVATRRLSFQNEINSVLTVTQDPVLLPQVAVEFLAERLGAQRVSFMLVDPDSRTLEIVASVGMEEYLDKVSTCRIGEGVAGLVAQRGQSLLYAEGQSSASIPHNTHLGYHADSFVSVPLFVPQQAGSGEVIAVINVSNRENLEPFGEEDLDLAETLARMLAIRLDTTQAAKREMKATTYQAVLAFTEALDAKDHTTGEHADGMLKYVLAVGEQMGLKGEELEILQFGAVLHDIGKLAVPQDILQKPGKLTDEEFDTLKGHCRAGGDIIRPMRFLEQVVQVVEMHHERYDGEGYPYGLAGVDIPIQARIVAVLDAYDAMMADRPYRDSIGRQVALAELEKHAGTQFDPQVVEAFLEVLEKENPV